VARQFLNTALPLCWNGKSCSAINDLGELTGRPVAQNRHSTSYSVAGSIAGGFLLHAPSIPPAAHSPLPFTERKQHDIHQLAVIKSLQQHRKSAVSNPLSAFQRETRTHASQHVNQQKSQGKNNHRNAATSSRCPQMRDLR